MENTIVLNKKIAMDFHNFAKSLPEYPNDYGAMRELRNDLMRICDVTELEAFNILRGFHIKEYIERYENSKTTDVKIVEKSNAPKEIIDLLAAYEKNYIYSGPGSKISDYAQQLILSYFLNAMSWAKKFP